MAADALKAYNSFRKKVLSGNIKLDVDTFKARLFTSSSNCADPTMVKLADLDYEVDGGSNGYVEYPMTVTLSEPSAAVEKWDSDDPEFEASGGSIVCRYLVIYDDTPTSPDANPLVGWILLDNTPANITVPDGSVLKVTIDADGIFDVTGLD